MKTFLSLLAIVALTGTALHAEPAPDVKSLLDRFKTYEQGQPVEWVAATRQALFEKTNDKAILAQREQLMIDFLASDANPQAKAIVIEWIGLLGSDRSVPALVKARETPALAAPVAAALVRLPGPEAKKARVPVTLTPPAAPGGSSAAAAALTDELAKDSHSAKADALLAKALGEKDDDLALAAVRFIRHGAGSDALLLGVFLALRDLPLPRQVSILEALAARPGAAPGVRTHLVTPLGESSVEQRAALLPVFGRVAQAEDTGLLLSAASDPTPEVAAAARTAFARATAPGLDAELAKLASGKDVPLARTAIAILADRAATREIPALWDVVAKGDATLAPAALSAISSLLPPDELPALLAKFSAADGTPLAEAFGKATWAVARRHPEPGQAAAYLDKAATTAPAAVKDVLTKQAARLRSAQPDSPASAMTLDLPAKDDRNLLEPNGYEEVLALDCGTTAEAKAGALSIRRTTGSEYQFGNARHPLATVDFGKSVAYEINGLDPKGDYVLGFSAWDADGGKRRQSLEIDGKLVLPDFLPLAWHADKPTFTRIHVPLGSEAATDGKVSLAFKCLAGPNAVVSEIWLCQRKAATPVKRILLVTGDDYPAHHWRETGPEFARILRADPRLEVTIAESPAVLGSPALSHYQAVFLHFKNYAERLPTSEPLWKNLEQYIQGGGGLVVAHFGCGALQEWTGCVKSIGRVWDPKKRGHDPYGEFMVRLLAKDHPATKGLKDFATQDELYTCLVGDTPIEVLAEATSKVDQSIHPMAFVLTPGKGRVFHCPLGHDLGALKAEGVKALYLRGTLWAAGEK